MASTLFTRWEGTKHFAPQGSCLTKAMEDNSVSQNMKSGLVAAKELTDVARETALMQENSAKVFGDRLTCRSVHAIKLNSRCTWRSASSWDRTRRPAVSSRCWRRSRPPLTSWLQSTIPPWQRLSNHLVASCDFVSQVNELVKELVRYSEELHKKHKQIKVLCDHFFSWGCSDSYFPCPHINLSGWRVWYEWCREVFDRNFSASR